MAASVAPDAAGKHGHARQPLPPSAFVAPGALGSGEPAGHRSSPPCSRDPGSARSEQRTSLVAAEGWLCRSAIVADLSAAGASRKYLPAFRSAGARHRRVQQEPKRGLLGEPLAACDSAGRPLVNRSRDRAAGGSKPVSDDIRQEFQTSTNCPGCIRSGIDAVIVVPIAGCEWIPPPQWRARRASDLYPARQRPILGQKASQRPGRDLSYSAPVGV